MYNQFFTIKSRISEKNGVSKVVHLIYTHTIYTVMGKSSGTVKYFSELHFFGKMLNTEVLGFFPGYLMVILNSTLTTTLKVISKSSSLF